MKKFILLTVITALLLCGCGSQQLSAPPQTVIPPTESPVTPLPLEIPPLGQPAPQTDPVVPETQPTEPPIERPTDPPVPETQPKPAPKKLYLEDYFHQEYTDPDTGKSHCIHLPRVVWNGSTDLAINDQLYNEHQPMIYDDGEINRNLRVSYFLGKAKDYASIVTVFSAPNGEFSYCTVSHISMSTGRPASDDEILAAFGYDHHSFVSEIHRILERDYEENNPGETDQEYEDMKVLQLSGSNLDICRPYIDEKGRLCATNFSYGYLINDTWYQLMCLETGDPPSSSITRCDCN